MPFVARIGLLCIAILVVGTPQQARGEKLELSPRRAVGDVYALSLDFRSESVFRGQGLKRSSAEDAVALHYEANVRVIEIDDAGHPIRERHHDVVVRSTSGDETTFMFREAVAFEVRREGDGEVRLVAKDGRVGGAVEKRIAALLEGQLEQSLATELLDPRREVEVGDHWELDPTLARRFLSANGLRAIALGEGATAELARREDGGGLVLRYAIPVSWWKPKRLPASAAAGPSDARFEGEVELVAESALRPVRHASRLTAHAAGVVIATGYATPAPWRLDLASASDQRIRSARKPVAANF